MLICITVTISVKFHEESHTPLHDETKSKELFSIFCYNYCRDRFLLAQIWLIWQGYMYKEYDYRVLRKRFFKASSNFWKGFYRELCWQSLKFFKVFLKKDVSHFPIRFSKNIQSLADAKNSHVFPNLILHLSTSVCEIREDIPLSSETTNLFIYFVEVQVSKRICKSVAG